jgi:hypothetical protein
MPYPILSPYTVRSRRRAIPRRELSGAAAPAAPRPKVARCDREMGLVALSGSISRYTSLVGPTAELQLGAPVRGPLRAAAARSPRPRNARRRRIFRRGRLIFRLSNITRKTDGSSR